MTAYTYITLKPGIDSDTSMNVLGFNLFPEFTVTCFDITNTWYAYLYFRFMILLRDPLPPGQHRREVMATALYELINAAYYI